MPSTPLLTTSQRRHFEVVLAKLEDALDEIDRLACRDVRQPQQRRFTDIADDLPPDFAARITPASQSARDVIADLAQRLGLAPQPASPFRTVRALLHAEIVRLQDSVSSALKGYGVVDSRAPAVIDPALRELITHLAMMLRALDSPDTQAPAEGRKG